MNWWGDNTPTVSQIRDFFREYVDDLEELDKLREQLAEYEARILSPAITAKPGTIRAPTISTDGLEKRVIQLERLREKVKRMERATDRESRSRLIALLAGGGCNKAADMASLLTMIYMDGRTLTQATEALFGVLRSDPRYQTYLRRSIRLRARAFEVLSEICPDDLIERGQEFDR